MGFPFNLLLLSVTVDLFVEGIGAQPHQTRADACLGHVEQTGAIERKKKMCEARAHCLSNDSRGWACSSTERGVGAQRITSNRFFRGPTTPGPFYTRTPAYELFRGSQRPVSCSVGWADGRKKALKTKIQTNPKPTPNQPETPATSLRRAPSQP